MYEESVGDTADPAAHARGVCLTAKKCDGCTLWKASDNTESGVLDKLWGVQS